MKQRSLMALILLAGFFETAAPVWAEDSIGETLRALFGLEKPVAPEVVNQFTPHLKKLLTNEIHFVRKVCGPNAEQLAQIRQAGEATVIDIAKKYAELQQQNRHNSREWPDARELLTAALQAKIDELLPEATARRYVSEIAARTAARKQATLEMMTMLVDRQLSLTPEQYDRVAERLEEKWQDGWSRELQVFLFYDQYAPLPDAELLKPVLDKSQQALWATRVRYGTIRFGWENELFGMDQGGIGLTELEEYPAEGAK